MQLFLVEKAADCWSISSTGEQEQWNQIDQVISDADGDMDQPGRHTVAAVNLQKQS